jgi:uncharacterized membrane protein
MKKIIACCAATALFAFTGCDGNKSPTGGGVSQATPPSKAARPTESDEASKKDATFRIVAPSGTTTIKRGDAKTVKISLDREKNFNQDVYLKITTPNGLTAEPAAPEIKASEKKAEVEVRISAAKDAPVGEQTIRIVATPAEGKPTEVDLRVKVEEAK